MKRGQLYCWGHDFPLPTRCCSPSNMHHCYSRWLWHPVKHRKENKDSMSVGWHEHLGVLLVPFVRGQSIKQGNCHLQQLVTAKLLATSRLSMWGVSLNSEVPNWTIPIRNALYSWSAPRGNRPPAIDSKRLSFSIVKYKNRHFNAILSQSCDLSYYLNFYICIYFF